MPSLLERLREALAPRYEVSQELARGGMGVVYLGYDRHLDRSVAVKILRPELATAQLAERFVRESRLLAKLSHPNIVPVHDAGEAGGVSYYVMDHVQGETLEQRLRRGLLTREDALQVGRDMLAALDAAHAHGIVHRDIKPSNVFLQGDRAMLADFGVARLAGAADPLTQPGAVIGTPGYMSPEQMMGKESTPRTDLYAVGMVLYEALTGRLWDPPPDDGAADWKGVPRELIPVLRRALAWQADLRWADAPEFRKALTRAAMRRPAWRVAAVPSVVVGAAIGVFILVWNGRDGEPPGAQQRLRVEAFRSVGAAAQPWLGDSVARFMARALAGSPDYVVVGPGRGRPRQDPPGGIVLGGTARSERDSVCVEVSLRSVPDRPALASDCAPADGWVGLVEGLARPVLREILRRNLVRDLPVRALPRTRAGLDAFLEAERLFAQAQWEDAHEAYQAAEAVDSTCWLCSWRIHDVQRWLGMPHDQVRTARYLAHADSFPPHYAVLMRASAAPIADRIEMERQAAESYGFFFAWWVLGDDLFHRGPLLGRSRRDALAAFARAAELRPDFAPAWEHLTLVRIAEGDEGGARAALNTWLETMGGRPRDRFSVVVRQWLETAWAWRFRSGPEAAEVLERALGLPEVAGFPLLAAAPRELLGTFDAPEGAIWLGRRFTRWRERPNLEPIGLLSQALGHVTLGQLDSARVPLQRLQARPPGPEFELFVVELQAALLLVDSAAAGEWRVPTMRMIRRYAATGALPPRLSARAAGVLALLLDQEGSDQAGQHAPTATSGFRRLLEARQLARRQQWDAALVHSTATVADTAAQLSDPILRALLRLDRADWYARTGNSEAARRELRWAEHSDVRGYPTGEPQPADVDWGLRTLARWRLATTLDAAGQWDDEVCRAYTRVARLWSAGLPVYRARADTARTRAQAHDCPPSL